MSNPPHQNNIHEFGIGLWQFVLYNPSDTVGPYEGELFIKKDLYVVENDEFTVFVAPAQNVSSVVNCELNK